MTRVEILKLYRVNSSGIIVESGKFDGAPVYTPHFLEQYLAGYSINDEEDYADLVITDDDRAEFPELGTDCSLVRLSVDAFGFVCCDLVQMQQTEFDFEEADSAKDA